MCYNIASLVTALVQICIRMPCFILLIESRTTSTEHVGLFLTLPQWSKPKDRERGRYREKRKDVYKDDIQRYAPPHSSVPGYSRVSHLSKDDEADPLVVLVGHRLLRGQIHTVI